MEEVDVGCLGLRRREGAGEKVGFGDGDQLAEFFGGGKYSLLAAFGVYEDGLLLEIVVGWADAEWFAEAEAEFRPGDETEAEGERCGAVESGELVLGGDDGAAGPVLGPGQGL